MRPNKYPFSFFLVASIASLTARAQQVHVADLTINDGNAATMSIELTGATGFNGAGMYIQLPEGFYFQLPQAGTATEGTTQQLSAREQESSLLKFALIDTENNAAFTRDGSLLTAQVACAPGTTGGNYTAMVKAIEFSRAGSAAGLTTLPDLTFKIKVTNVADAVSLPAAPASAPADIYDAAGQRVQTAHKGICIYKLPDGSVKKVLIR